MTYLVYVPKFGGGLTGEKWPDDRPMPVFKETAKRTFGSVKLSAEEERMRITELLVKYPPPEA
jgi:hypothetical protein